MYLRAFGAIALLILSASSVAARGPFGSVNVGNWSGGAFTNDQTGAFTGCIASANYKSGITVFVMVSNTTTFDPNLANNYASAPQSMIPDGSANDPGPCGPASTAGVRTCNLVAKVGALPAIAGVNPDLTEVAETAERFEDRDQRQSFAARPGLVRCQ